MVQVEVDKKKSPKRKFWSSTILLVTRFRRKQGKYMLQNVWPFDSPKTRGWFRKCYSNLYIYLTKSPSSTTPLDFSNTKKNLGQPSPHPSDSALKLALASASFNLSAAKLSVTWAFISSPCSRSAMASKVRSRKWTSFLWGFFWWKERSQTLNVWYIFVHLVHFYGKMKVNIYHTWSVWDLVSRGVFFFPKASISAPTTFTTPDQCFVWRNRRGIQIRPAFQRHSPSSEGKPLHLGIANCPEFINWLQKVKRVK